MLKFNKHIFKLELQNNRVIIRGMVFMILHICFQYMQLNTSKIPLLFMKNGTHRKKIFCIKKHTL